jgi:hypothetical protein
VADDLEKRVKAVYRRHYQDTHNWATAWNRTLTDITGNYDPQAPDQYHRLRDRVSIILKKVDHELRVEQGDPLTLAVDAAIRDLRRDKVVEFVRHEYRKSEAERADRVQLELRQNPIRKGPKERTPNRAQREIELERALDRDREKYPNEMRLYVLFDEKGGLRGWQVDTPDYFQGNSGPVAEVPASDRLTYGEVKSEIEEVLHSLEWELEDEDGD